MCVCFSLQFIQCNYSNYLKSESLGHNTCGWDIIGDLYYWKKLFESFLATLETSPSTIISRTEKLTILFLTRIYINISSPKDYETADDILEKLFVGKKITRHLLATKRQQSGENFGYDIQVLNTLSRVCDIKSLTAEEALDEFIRETFINRILS